MASLRKLALSGPVPSTDDFKIKELIDDTFDLQDMKIYGAAQKWLLQKNESSKLLINNATLIRVSGSAIEAAAWKIVLRENKVTAAIALFGLLPTGIGIIGMLIVFVLSQVMAHQAAQWVPMVRGAQDKLRTGSPKAQNANTTGSLSAELKDLMELHKNGAPTETEFAVAKSKLLKNGAA